MIPPFAYSYQCGSTLLTSYIPVYIYSTSLQIIVVFLRLFCTFSPVNLLSHELLASWFSGICWPQYWDTLDLPPSRLIEPHQIISIGMSHIILLLSFGLTSPILCGFIAFSICLNYCAWLMLIGRFLDLRGKPQHAGGLFSVFLSLSLHRGQNS